eukprot:scaffold748_cov251-Pinguiococcus_pyrenoidosus.AAC.47
MVPLWVLSNSQSFPLGSLELAGFGSPRERRRLLLQLLSRRTRKTGCDCARFSRASKRGPVRHVVSPQLASISLDGEPGRKRQKTMAMATETDLSQNAKFMDLYSRQIGAFGLETMSKLINMKVLLVGLSGVGIEVAKNLVLAGPGKVTILDDTPAKLEDCGVNFYISLELTPRVSRCRKRGGCGEETVGGVRPSPSGAQQPGPSGRARGRAERGAGGGA